MVATPASPSALFDALTALAHSAQTNIPGTDFTSITVKDADGTLRTLAATDPIAEKADALQYELREGPCYAAVTEERLVLVTDLAAATHDYPAFAPRAAELGVRAQAAIQLVQNGEHAGLNLYARRRGAFDSSTVQFAELFASQAAALLGYAVQVEQLSEALHTRTDIATAVGIVMERHSIDRDRAFAYLVRISNDRNLKIRLLAQQILDGTFTSNPHEVRRSQHWP